MLLGVFLFGIDIVASHASGKIPQEFRRETNRRLFAVNTCSR
jgi:hypothetical protein